MSQQDKDDKALYDEIMAEREAIEAPCKPTRYRVLKRIVSNPKNRFVVGFGAGSVPGLAGNAALASILEDLELRPLVKEIWGVSAGAAIGGTWATGATSRQHLELLDALNRPGVVDFSMKELLFRWLPRFVMTRKLPDGLVPGRHFKNAIEAALQVDTFEECEIPFRCIACTDDGHARKVVFRKGPLLNAIRASMCIPGVFMPVQDWNGADYGYLDGAVVEKTPVISIIEEHRRASRDTNLVVLCTHFDDEARIKRPEGFLKRLMSVTSRLEEKNWDYLLLQAHQDETSRFLVLNPKMQVGGMLDFGMAPFHFLWARKYFKEQLSNARVAGRFDAK